MKTFCARSFARFHAVLPYFAIIRSMPVGYACSKFLLLTMQVQVRLLAAILGEVPQLSGRIEFLCSI